MSNGATTLTYAVRGRVVVYYLALLAFMLALLELPPLAVAWAVGEQTTAWRYLVMVVVLLAAAAAGRRLHTPGRIQSNEAAVVAALAFVLAPLVALYPLTASGLGPLDAWFEAVSGVTTTGLSVAGSVDQRSPAFHFGRAWLQWYGGLGIAVLSVALFMGRHAAARRLVAATENEDPATTARTQARQVLLAYAALTVGGVALLAAVTGAPFTAVVYMLSTVSTGGFAPADSSLAALSKAGAWVVTGYCLLGAVPLLAYVHGLRRGRQILRDPEVRALAVMTLLVWLALTWTMASGAGLGWTAALKQGLWLGTSAQTTTGFSALQVADLDPASKVVVMVAMLVGGSTGSTAGGIKLLRLLVVIELLRYFLRRSAMPPHAAIEPRLAGRALDTSDIALAALLIALFAAAVVLSWVVFVAWGYAPLDSLFEVASALGTVGLSTGITAPDLPAPLKVVLGLDMLLGRLEIVTLLILLYPRTWLGRRS